MRRLSKPWSPANVSPHGQEPRSFADAERVYLAALPQAENPSRTARTEFNRLDKPKLRAVMYQEQGSLCAYCEQRLEEQPPEPRIDHWRPLAQHPELALHWENLYLSCPTPETCDVVKGQVYEKLNPAGNDPPSPAEFDYGRHLGFGLRGEVYVRRDRGLSPNDLDVLRLAVEHEPDELERPRSYLNLNHPALVAARKAEVDSEMDRLRRDFEGKHATDEDRERRATALLHQTPLPQFVSIRVSWLRKQLGKGK